MYITFFSFLELQMFLDGQVDYWSDKQKEVEQRFLELEKQDQSASSYKEPKQKRRKRTKKETQKLPSEDPFSKYAAQLQIEFFVKVSNVFQ